MMGRKTFEAIGRPLPGRENLVISRSADYQPPGCRAFTSIESGLDYAAACDELFIIGGATLYQALLPIADYLYLTLIHRDFDGDTFFPEIDLTAWRELSREDIGDDSQVDYAYSFLKLEKLAK